MKSKFIILGLMSILLIGCAKKELESTKPNPKVAEMVGNGFNSIQEAVAKAIGIECIYTDPDDGEQVKVYFKGQVVGLRAGEKSKTPNFAGLIKDNNIYLWDVAKKGEGWRIDMAKVEVDSSLSVAGKKVRSTQDVVEAMEPHKSNCKESLEKNVYELPSDVTFK